MQPATRDHARTGLSFTELGLGGAPLANLYRAIEDEEAEAIMHAAWAGGVRHFDTAPLYGLGLSETRFNRFLRGRSGYVLASKVGRILRAVRPAEREGQDKWFEVPARVGVYDYSHDGILRSYEDSLARLGVDAIDILHVHDLDERNQGGAIEGNRADLMEGGMRALLSLRDQGAIKGIGIGVNEWQAAQWLVERADLDVLLLAGRYTLLEPEESRPFMDLCAERGIGVIIGGPYNSGVLAGGEFFDYGAIPPEVAERAGRLRAVCADHGVRLLDAAFRFPLRHPAVVSVVPGSQTLMEMEDNLRAASAEIPEALWDDLAAQGLIPGS
jgi:D-threo-aldose 1-dehydrogenase